MIQFTYFTPSPDVRPLVSSYYLVETSKALSDLMRAEIANIRFVLNGEIVSNIGGSDTRYPPRSTMLCGPTNRASSVKFSENMQVLGAAVTPLGWKRMIRGSAENFADQIVSLDDHVPNFAIEHLEGIWRNDPVPEKVAAMDALFASMDDQSQQTHDAFLAQATEWLTDPQPNELQDLLGSVELSHRQVDRLCRIYFGCSPKKLHRKFRALHSANRLTWKNLTDWRDIATTAYFDQSHFIKEFKQFNGRTPQEFIDGPHILVRQTLQERLQIAHHSPYSLVG